MSDDENSNVSGEEEDNEENEDGSQEGSGEGEEGEEKESGEEKEGSGEEGEEESQEGSGEGEEGSGEENDGSGDGSEDDKSKKNKSSPLVQTNEVKIDITPFNMNEISIPRKKSALELLQDINKDLNDLYSDLKSNISNFGEEKVFGYNINYQFGGKDLNHKYKNNRKSSKISSRQL